MLLEGHTRTCTGAMFPDAPPAWMPSCLVSCGADCSVTVWNLAQRRAEHDTGMLGASAICTLTQLPSHSADELRVACGTLDSRIFVFALKAWGGGTQAGEAAKMYLYLLFTVDTAPVLKRLFGSRSDTESPPASATAPFGSPPVVRVKAPTRRARRGPPVQHPTQWDDSTVISARAQAASSHTGKGSPPPEESYQPLPVLYLKEVAMPSAQSVAKLDQASRWQGGAGMFGELQSAALPQPAAEHDALPAWALPAAAPSAAPAHGGIQPPPEQGTACLLVATPFHVLLVSKVSNKVLFAAAMCDLVGARDALHDCAPDTDGMVTHLLCKAGIPMLLLAQQDEACVHHMYPLTFPEPAAEGRNVWLDSGDKRPQGTRQAQVRAASANTAVDPTLPSWLQSPTAAAPAPGGFATIPPNGAQCPPFTLFPPGQLPDTSPLRSASATAPNTPSASDLSPAAATASLPSRRRAGAGGQAPIPRPGPAPRGLSPGAAKGGRSVRSSGYGSVKPRAMFGADSRCGKSAGSSSKPPSSSLAGLQYPPQTAPPGNVDAIGTSSLGVLCHVTAVSPPPAVVSSSGFFSAARAAVRGMGVTSAQWSSTGNSLCVGYADGSVATASMPSVWRKAVVRGDAALAVQCAASVRRYSTQSSRPARALWSHHAYAVAAGRQLKQAAGGSSADLLGSQRDMLQAGASAPLLVGWGSGSDAVHVWGTAADVPLLVMDPETTGTRGGVVDAGFVYGDAALAVAREGSVHLHRLQLREGVDGTASVAAGLQQRHPRGNNSKLLASCTVAQGDAGKITAMATMNAPRATLAVAATSDRALHIVDLAVGAVALTLRDTHTRAVHALALPCSSHAASLAPAGMHTLLSAAPSDSAAVAAAGRAANSGVLVWDLRCCGGASSAPVASLSGHSHRSAAHRGCLALSPCGQYAAVGSDDNATYVYDLRMCVPLHDDAEHRALGSCSFLSKLRGARDTVAAVAFNPHTPCLATAGLDGVVRLYTQARS